MESINSVYCQRQQCKRRGTEWSLLTETTVTGTGRVDAVQATQDSRRQEDFAEVLRPLKHHWNTSTENKCKQRALLLLFHFNHCQT